MILNPLSPLTTASRKLILFMALACAPVLSQAQADAPATAAGAQPAQVVAVSELSSIPAPVVPARAWLTLDANSGQVIGANNPTQQVEPASLTKLMAAYVVFDAIKGGRMSLDQMVTVSEKAWRTGGSRMFIEVNSQVSVDDLLQGVIVQSGNDATVALAEAVAGSEDAFVALMNEEAQRQGLADTHYTNSPGMPDPQHMTTVRDLATLATNLVNDFPEFLHYYSQKEFTYNKIKQPNRNRLLWADSTVDGLKTGHTSSAGYCLITTALRDGRRVVSVLVGAESEAARAESSLKLLNWSYQNFDTIKLFDKDQPAVQARVWEGEAETVDLGQTTPIWITVPRGKGPEVEPIAHYRQPLIAPLTKGSEVGTVSLSLDGKVLREEPLAVMNDVAQAGIFGRLYDKVRLMLQ
ncbi:D-alanyl-D-alanine carboxypeptidase family protein [Pusillimonas sp.]|uniref:D-alanyl-D-alanine carboxypeptidase family protein n=1 Tax=Pusillimonas sp. TaxID=3040095 RepID=UPI0037C769DE